jgi:hypothetical protein
MRNILWVAGWAAAAYVAYKIIDSNPFGEAPVVKLAHQLEDAWADHHTQA